MTDSHCISAPFSHLKIDDFHQLDEEEGRTTCPECNRSRKYFCYTCYCPVTRLAPLTPRVKLPLQIDIIKHPLERDGKSTACHAAVISPDHVHIHTFPTFPDFDPDKTVLVFPGKDAVQLENTALHIPQLTHCLASDARQTEQCSLKAEAIRPNADISTFTVIKEPDCDNKLSPHDLEKSETLECTERQRCSKYDRLTHRNHSALKQTHTACQDRTIQESGVIVSPSFDTVIFIDSTWNQTYGMLQDGRLKGLRKVELKSRTSQFWRRQKGSPDTFLSTIEAIYYFVRDYHDLFVRTPYDGEYDNLLFFFSCLFEKVNTAKAERINGT